MKSRRIKTTGEGTSTRRNDEVVGARKTGDAVEKDNDISAMLDETLRSLDHHLRHTLMALRKLIKRRINDLDLRSHNGLLNVRHLLRTLIDQQNDHMHIRMIRRDCLSHLLEQGRLSCLRRRHNHTSLSLSDWSKQIKNSHRRAALSRSLHVKTLVREYRSQTLKIRALLDHADRIAVDIADV